MIEKIGAQIRAQRKACGLTLEALSGKADISRGTLTQIETGTGNPRISSIMAVMKVLDLKFRVSVMRDAEKLPEYPPGSW